MKRPTSNIVSLSFLYDFSVHGGTAGNITLTGAPTIPANAIVSLFDYDVLTTCTSSTDAATIAIGFATDGNLTTAIAISNAGNFWDAGIHTIIAATPTVNVNNAIKLTAARQPILVVASENLTAGKIRFRIEYWISNS